MASSSSNASAPAEVVLPRGFVFEPSDEELVNNYLIPKVYGGKQGSGAWFFKEEDIYKHEPSKLKGLARDSKHKNMYFFTPLHKKGQNKRGKNAERQVPGGCWRKTGEICYFNDKNGKPIAKKTSLAYYKDEASKLVKGEWLIKEYMLLESEQPNPNNQQSNMTICVVYHKPPCKSKNRND